MVYAMMPGVEEKDITVNVSTWEINISAEHKAVGYRKRLTLPVPVVPQVKNLIFSNSLLRFTLQRTE